MTRFDDWFYSQLENYYKSCEPKASGHSPEEVIYNCEYCEEYNCEYWETYNNIKGVKTKK